MTLVERLRDQIQTIRRKPTPIADLIPMLAEAADALEKHERREPFAVVERADNLDGFVFKEIDGRMKWIRIGDLVYSIPKPVSLKDLHGK
jgi:hypothetical protein